MSDVLSAYIPIDRRQALARGDTLPDRAAGAALFADVAGFTPLAETLVRELGPRRGAEELTVQLNRIYDTLIGAVHAYGGSVVGFSGDAITCWFDDQGLGAGDLGPEEPQPQAPSPRRPSPAALRAVACAITMQRAMRQLTIVTTPAGALVALAIKTAIAGGVVRRFLIGDPNIQLLDVLAGRTLDRLAAAEKLAERGEVVLDAQTAVLLGNAVSFAAWRSDEQTGRQIAVVASLAQPVAQRPWQLAPAGQLSDAQVRPWLAPAVYARMGGGHDQYLAELRPVVALMLAFDGIDYDQDAGAGARLDAFVRRIQQVVARHEGHMLDVTIGDKGSYLYAAFGATVAHDDDAARAVAAALDLRAAAPGVRIGLASGQMRCGAYGGAGRRTYGVLGDRTNLAARLMGIAEPSTIACDGATYAQARRYWDFVALPPVHVKGKAGLIPVYRPTGAPAQQGGALAHARALVGRRAEVAELCDCLEALEAGASRVLVLEGEAGIGKSQLLDELTGLLHERGMVGLVGSAQSAEQISYRAWRSIFVSYFGLGEIDGAAAARSRLGAAGPLERWARVRMRALGVVPDLVERLPLLNDVLGLGLPDTEHTRALDITVRSQRLRDLLIELLRAWAAEQPLVLIVEDAHELDTLACDLAVGVARALSEAGLPLLLVLALRPLADGHPLRPLLAELLALPGARNLELGPLSRPEIIALSAARLELAAADLPAQVADLVCDRADGNPLFAEELIAMLREEELIRVERAAGGSRCVVAGDLSRAGASLPDTLQGLLLARVDRLPPEERLTLKVAAVLGPIFEYLPLYHARSQQSAIDELGLKHQLLALAAQNFTALETPEPQLAYRFRHILTQEAAYQTLLYAQRRELHRTVAGWYEQTYGAASGDRQVTTGERASAQHDGLAPYIGLLAYHYRQAEEPERERHYVGLLGEQAFNISAFREAIACFERALALTPGEDETARGRRARLTAQIARSYLLLGEHDMARQLYQQSLAIAGAAGDQAAAAAASYELGSLAYRQGARAEALGHLERSLALYSAAHDPAGEGRALDRLGGLYIELGDEARALECYQRAIAIGRRGANGRG